MEANEAVAFTKADVDKWMRSAKSTIHKKKAHKKGAKRAQHVLHSFHNSERYFAAVKLLRGKFQRGTMKEAITELGYECFDSNGTKKGSGNDYGKVLDSFCDGQMKTALKSQESLDTTAWTDLSTPMRMSDPFYKAVVKFQSENNSGNGRLVNAWSILGYAQLLQLHRSVEDGSISVPKAP
jgi:hypothetical protein